MPKAKDFRHEGKGDVSPTIDAHDELLAIIADVANCLEKMKSMRGSSLRNYVHETADWVNASTAMIQKKEITLKPKKRKADKDANGHSEIDANGIQRSK